MVKRNTQTSLFLQEWYQGSRKALDGLLEEHLPWIRSHVSRRLGPMLRQKAETGDVVQEAIIQFLRYGPRIQISDGGHFRALMCRIVENVLRDEKDWFTARRRAISRERPLPSDTILNLDPHHKAPDSPSQVALQQEQEAWIRLGLEVLEPEEREVLILRDWDDFSFGDIGKRLGISLHAARRKYIRALNSLTESVWALRNKRLASAF